MRAEGEDEEIIKADYLLKICTLRSWIGKELNIESRLRGNLCTWFSHFCFIYSEHSYPELLEIRLSMSAPSLSFPTPLPQVNKSNYCNFKDPVIFLNPILFFFLFFFKLQR